MDAQIVEPQVARVEWIIEEDDWSGVYDCGAIFMPREPVVLFGDRDDWPIEQCS